MRRWKKLLIALLFVLLVSQIPFAYRRYKLDRLHSAIQQVNSQRSMDQTDGWVEYTGVVHVHSFLGGHSKGNFEEIIAAARSNRLNFVVMTEHTSSSVNTAAMTLKGDHGGILFINGNEVSTSTSDRLLVIPGDESVANDGALPTSDVLAQTKSRGALAYVAYPPEFKSWEAGGYDGVEVYNVYTNARQINPVVMFFDGLWSYRSYPDLLFAAFYTRPAESLKMWDQAMRSTGRKLVAIPGNDAHANVGLSLTDAAGKSLLGVQLDPYERSFRLVRLHVLIPKEKPLTRESLQEALAQGHCFTGFDLFGDTTGFNFVASNGPQTRIQGDEVSLENGLHLRVTIPVTGRVLLFKDGNVVRDEAGVKRSEYAVSEKGVYRVEIYLPQLPGQVANQPWIISNPIYVR